MSLGIWRSVILRTNPKQVVYGFGHDLSDAEVWIVQGGGKRIARLSASLSIAETEEVGRINTTSSGAGRDVQGSVETTGEGPAPQCKSSTCIDSWCATRTGAAVGRSSDGQD